MSIFGGIGSALGGIVGSVVPGVGTALGATIGGGLGTAAGGLFGGSSGGGSKTKGGDGGGAGAGGGYGGYGGYGGGGGYTQVISNPYAQAAAQLAAQNNPLTAAYQGLSLMQGALAGQMSTKANTEANAQLSILKEALERGQADTKLQASVAGYGAGKGLESLYNLNQGRLSTELLSPQFLSQAGSASLAGQNALANQFGQTNLGIKALQEQTLAQISGDQAKTLSNVFNTRAENEGRLALGAQAYESAANLDKVRTLGDLARTQAATKGQLALKKFGANQAMAGARMFA
jgi:hypothetical protein